MKLVFDLKYKCEKCGSIGDHLVNSVRQCEKCGSEFVMKCQVPRLVGRAVWDEYIPQSDTPEITGMVTL